MPAASSRAWKRAKSVARAAAALALDADQAGHQRRFDHVAALLTKILFEEPPPLRSLAPSIGEDLAALVHRCLEKDPSRRVASAIALREALRAHSQNAPPNEGTLP